MIISDFAIKRPLITVAGTMDALLPIDGHDRAYARKVEAARGHDGDGDFQREDDVRTELHNPSP